MATDIENETSSKYKIYTKTGDTGTSSLYNGQRLPKDADYFCALGDVDELNSVVGAAREFCGPECASTCSQLEVIQSRLLDVGSAVATPNNSSQFKLNRTRFDASSTTQLEAWIDEMDTSLPALKNFILPSGGKASVFLHMARSICRRAERSVIPLTREGHIDEQVAVYLNRLSDYLFTAARFTASLQECPEVIYRKQS
ncbi:hypothetical protein CEUSTIGMA_g8900.t1 [Chlamydomonas eustigma]|uniref:Corrinoid adenosyltransferase MMAB n=1 Tax=Chlamydomonas eustigma TaxID=1157962 RepID=A0A250XEJ9_9CHLO|nr:hypothetical protein CEUSTIGMA_g8900.t1 [Chlamydomonas eustigma]|eukprot:GAX81471.1 hypothetical protein CEUSTIGMA_g8900.t1 [Chlamydomonas eustigma]